MTRTPLVTAGMLLGIGMGGFIDGILFHQVLQLHSLLSAKVSRTTLVGLETNMFWDGIFHLLTWLTTAAGLAMLWHVARRGDVRLSNATFLGSLGLGWGLFNLVEGVVDHHLLHLHHVVEGPNHLKYDLAFLASGAVLIAIGSALVWRDRLQLRPQDSR